MPYLPFPPPLPDAESRPFWEGCERRELRIQRCADCGLFHHPPIPVCARCQSWNRVWQKVSGRGRVHAVTVVTHALFPGIPVPYDVAQIELEEQPGLILLGNVVGCSPEEVSIGMPVRATFEEVGPGITMYYFERER